MSIPKTNSKSRVRSLKEEDDPSHHPILSVLQKGDTITLRRYNKQESYWRVDVNGLKLRAKVYIDVVFDKGASPNASPRPSHTNGLPVNCSVADLLKLATSPFLIPESSKKPPPPVHPLPIPETTKRFLNEEMSLLHTEFQTLQTEWNLIIRAYSQEFITDATLENPLVVYKPKPHDLMFSKMLENPYQTIQQPKIFLHGIKTEDKPDTEGTTNEGDIKKTEEQPNEQRTTDPPAIRTSEHRNTGDRLPELRPGKENSENSEKENPENGDSEKRLSRRNRKISHGKVDSFVSKGELTVVQEVGALAPLRPFRYLDLLSSNINPGSVSQATLDELATLEFDVFPYKEEENEDFLILLTMNMFHKLGLVENFKIPDTTLYRFCKTLCLRYRAVPFHNFYHAWNVSQTLYFFLEGAGASSCLGHREKMAMLIATLCHDCDHPGLNNSFQAKASTRVSILHKKSTLENHHLLQCMNILAQPECNILQNMDNISKHTVEMYIRHLVLATDLALHGVIHHKLLEKKRVLAKYVSKQSESIDDDDLILLMCCLIKCADLSNEIRPTQTAQKWANLVMQEFFAQSDKERELALPVTPFMDKHRVIIAKEQMNFIEKLCVPLYEPLCSIFPLLQVCIKQMTMNRNEWNHRLLIFFSNDVNAIKKLPTESIWERDQVKVKKWGENLLALLSSRSSQR